MEPRPLALGAWNLSHWTTGKMLKDNLGTKKQTKTQQTTATTKPFFCANNSVARPLLAAGPRTGHRLEKLAEPRPPRTEGSEAATARRGFRARRRDPGAAAGEVVRAESRSTNRRDAAPDRALPLVPGSPGAGQAPSGSWELGGWRGRGVRRGSWNFNFLEDEVADGHASQLALSGRMPWVLGGRCW